MKTLGPGDPPVIGSYRVIGVLGTGGMGRVYLGQSLTGKRVAIKVVRPELVEEPEIRRRFAREVAAVRAVNPLFSAALVDADPDAAVPWLASTYIDGPNLEQYVGTHGPMGLGAVLTLAAGLAAGLASIHRAGLVHRDLKPSNILLTDEGPHIIDFGIALAQDATRMTTSLVVGTPSYMAPERVHGSEAGPLGDVFSLGATLVFAATGAKLINDGTILAQIQQLIAGRFNTTAVPKEIRPLIVRCISPDQRARPTADELSRILVASGAAPPSPGWYAEPGPPLGPVSLPQQGRQASRRRILAYSGAVGLAVAGSAAGLFAAQLAHQPTGAPAASPTPRDPLLWRLRSGAQPVVSRGDAPPRNRILVDRGQQVITTNGAEVYALDTTGQRRWVSATDTNPTDLRLWGDAVLIVDSSRIRCLDAVSGQPRFTLDLAATEQQASIVDNPEHLAVEIREVALSAEYAFVNLITAVVAIDRLGKPRWRMPRPAPVGGVRPPTPAPLAADATRLVGENVVGQTTQVSLLTAALPTLLWQRTYQLESRPPPLGPPQGAPQGAPGGTGGPGDRPPPGGSPRGNSEAHLSADLLALRDLSDVRVLRLADGSQAMHFTEPSIVMAIELAADLLFVAGEQLTAYRAVSGLPIWHAPIHRAMLAVSPDEATVVTVGDGSVSTLDQYGHLRASVPLPAEVAAAPVDDVSTDGNAVYVVFGAAPDAPPLPFDVLALPLRS
jgi:hypothetical protein